MFNQNLTSTVMLVTPSSTSPLNPRPLSRPPPSLIASRLDYCDSPFRTQTPSIHHVTPVRQQLHWLPVQFRIQFKVLLLTFKAIHNLDPP